MRTRMLPFRIVAPDVRRGTFRTFGRSRSASSPRRLPGIEKSGSFQGHPIAAEAPLLWVFEAFARLVADPPRAIVAQELKTTFVAAIHDNRFRIEIDRCRPIKQFRRRIPAFP